VLFVVMLVLILGMWSRSRLETHTVPERTAACSFWNSCKEQVPDYVHDRN